MNMLRATRSCIREICQGYFLMGYIRIESQFNCLRCAVGEKWIFVLDISEIFGIIEVVEWFGVVSVAFIVSVHHALLETTLILQFLRKYHIIYADITSTVSISTQNFSTTHLHQGTSTTLTWIMKTFHISDYCNTSVLLVICNVSISPSLPILSALLPPMIGEKASSTSTSIDYRPMTEQTYASISSKYILLLWEFCLIM